MSSHSGALLEDGPIPASTSSSFYTELFPPRGASVEDGLAGLPRNGIKDIWKVNRPGANCQTRLLDRSAGFKQSTGRLQIKRLDPESSAMWLRYTDWFHTAVNFSSLNLLIACITVIVLGWLVFALAFWSAAKDCGLDNDSFLKSLFLSIETIETIGYGVPDSYFQSCTGGLAVLIAASLWETFAHALLIGIVFARISRPASRAGSVCFSDKAVISEIDGKLYFMFQVCDFRKHQLCEAHIRLYCIRHAETANGVAFQTRAMRLQHPDDELGAMLLLALPQVVVHRIDSFSPLCPEAPQAAPGSFRPPGSFRFPEVLQRDQAANLGLSGGTGSFPLSSTGGSGSPSPSKNMGLPVASAGLQDVSRQLVAGQYEVLCVVEGIDPTTSATLQARHSYTSDDVVFNASFARCVTRGTDGRCEVNFDAFHEVVNVSGDTDVGLCVQSWV